MQMTARLVQDGRTVQETPLSFAGETSTYSGHLKPSEPGAAVLEVWAMQPDKANFGWARKEIEIVP